MPNKNEREYRNMRFELRKENDDAKIVEGYATTFDEEYLLYDSEVYEVWEKVDRAAFDDCDMSDFIFQYNHEGHVYARNKNNTLEANADEHGLFIRADLGHTRIGRDLYEEINGGYTDQMSFGFTVAEDKREIIDNYENNKTKLIRTITRIGKLYDVSAVSIPANPNTEIGISARNFCDGLIAEIEAERLKAQKDKEELEARKAALKARIAGKGNT